MTIVIVLAAFAVMAVAAFVGAGRFGQWREPVTDRPKGRMPAADEPLAQARIPHAAFGYDRAEVDELLLALDGGAMAGDDLRFTVRGGGYDMQFVDELLAQHASARRNPPATAEATVEGGRMGDTTSEK